MRWWQWLVAGMAASIVLGHLVGVRLRHIARRYEKVDDGG